MNLEDIKKRLDYDPDTGLFTWNRKSGKVEAGVIGATGYLAIGIGKKIYKAHRLAWFMQHGEMPKCGIDHINGNRLDNRIENLRLANTSENNQNRKVAHRNNKSGLLGVSMRRRNGEPRYFSARIRIDNKLISLGSYPTAELAHQAYLNAKRELHPFGTI